MKFDEEGMNVFKQAVDNFMAAGESASFELAGRVLAAARMAVDAAEENLEDEMDELDEEGLEEVNKLAHEFLSSEAGIPDLELRRRMKRAMHLAFTGRYDDEDDEMVENL